MHTKRFPSAIGVSLDAHCNRQNVSSENQKRFYAAQCNCITCDYDKLFLHVPKLLLTATVHAHTCTTASKKNLNTNTCSNDE